MTCHIRSNRKCKQDVRDERLGGDGPGLLCEDTPYRIRETRKGRSEFEMDDSTVFI